MIGPSPRYLKEAGYTVMWWGKNDLLAPDAFPSSVTSATSIGGTGEGDNAFAFGEAGYYSFLNTAMEGAAEETPDGRNVMAAIEFLQSGPAEPFMIFLPLTKPHPPYTAPEPFYSAVDPEKLPPLRPAAGEGKPDYHRLIREYRNLTALDDGFFRRLHAVYLGSVAFMDFLFGLLMAAVEENGFANSTTTVVFADHGDYAGDYGLVEPAPRNASRTGWKAGEAVRPGVVLR